MENQNNKNLFSKFIVLLVVAMNTGFTLAVLYIFRKVGSEPKALIAAWFSFTTGELWILSSIKKAKVKNISEGSVLNDQGTTNQETNEP
jgi:hypothetical protein